MKSAVFTAVSQTPRSETYYRREQGNARRRRILGGCVNDCFLFQLHCLRFNRARQSPTLGWVSSPWVSRATATIPGLTP